MRFLSCAISGIRPLDATVEIGNEGAAAGTGRRQIRQGWLEVVLANHTVQNRVRVKGTLSAETALEKMLPFIPSSIGVNMTRSDLFSIITQSTTVREEWGNEKITTSPT